MKLNRAYKIMALTCSLAATLLMTGCLARNTNPSLPYVKPAQSVPYSDPSAVHIASRLDEMDKEIQRLRDMIERVQATGGNEGVIRNLQDRVAALEKQVGMGTAASNPGDSRPMPAPNQTNAPSQPMMSSEQKPQTKSERFGAPIEIQNTPVNPDEQIYREAFTAYRNGAFDQAAALFNEFLNKYPKNPLSPDAIYWFGETKLAQKKYDEAVIQFDRVLKEHPGSKKELDALLKLGEAFGRMGDDKSAKIIYQRIVSEHPHTAQARTAAAKVKGIQ